MDSTSASHDPRWDLGGDAADRRWSEPSDVPPAGPGRRRRGPRRGRRRRIVLWTAVGLVVLLLGGVALIYFKLDANLRSAPLDLGVAQHAEKPDPFGRTSLNILVIGSDTRLNRGDCRIGGDCGPGANADVEMVVHLSADRSNATVMSIPRDTITNIPQCTDPSGRLYPALPDTTVTTSLQDGGPGCTVAAVHALTGITIDHFVMIDFSGVVKMADDVGGVPVCVTANVADPYSHLRMTRGTHVIKGVQALEFLRTRHGFLFGADIYRTQAQHMYLSALIRKMKSASTLADPLTVYHLAEDATKALTVDPGLASITSLIGLAGDFNKVPAGRITFVTLPTVPYPGNPAAWVSPAMPAAQQLFQDMISDTPLTPGSVKALHATSSPTATPSPSPSLDKATVPVTVENGSGIALRAHAIAAALVSDGFTESAGDTNGPYTAATRLDYPPGHRAQARAVAAALGLPAALLHRGGNAITLIVGADWPTGTTYPAGPGTGGAAPGGGVVGTSPGPAANPSGPATPPPGSAPENAAQANVCAQVNPVYTF